MEVDENFAVREVSAGVERFSDSSHCLCFARDVRQCFPELIGLEDILQELLRGDRDSFELKGIARSTHPDQPLYIDLYIIGDRDDPEEDAKLMLFVEDVTERMVLEQTLVHRTNEAALLYNALASAKNYIDNIISSMADALLVVNSEGAIKTVNRATQELLGYTHAELVGQPINAIVQDAAFCKPASNYFPLPRMKF
ncbi:MAG: PAS domain S-box protein [Coleofasciculaceae cyanobacterium SM2_3_26]|nr:PAS domain S-box protein [Coleofasciculaceae cyanobacterium SM2_3_26]